MLKIETSLNKKKAKKEVPKNSVNELEHQILKDIETNKEQLRLNICDLENKIYESNTDRNIITEKIKKECEIQNKILKDLYKKVEKSNQNEINQIDQLKKENEIILKSIKQKNYRKDENLKNLGREKELEIMRTYLSKYSQELGTSQENLTKLNDQFNEFTRNIKTYEDEVLSKENSIKLINELEKKYFLNKNEIFEEFTKTQKSHINTEEKQNVDVSFKNILENENKILKQLDDIIYNLRKTNNTHNILAYNKSISYLNQKLTQLSEVSDDDFTKNLVKILSSSKRFYSNVEIFNEWQLIKRELLYNVVYSEIKQHFSDEKYPLAISKAASFSAELIYWITSKIPFYLIQSDKSCMKKLSACDRLYYGIRDEDYTSAFSGLKDLKDVNSNGLLNKLGFKLAVMTKQENSIDLLKNHFI